MGSDRAPIPGGKGRLQLLSWVRRVALGPPRDIQDPRTDHTISLIAFLAWVGLGTDGLSSSAYGPDEAFRATGEHTDLPTALALATSQFVILVIFAEQLVFRGKDWYRRLLHNETAVQLQRRLQFAGLDLMVLPVPVLSSQAGGA
jgi:hypothetical protein